MAFDIEGARKAGYSDQEIADHLSGQGKFDASAARSAGYSDAEIISHLVLGKQKAETPTIGQAITGKSSWGDYLQGRASDIGKIFQPETWRSVGSDLSGLANMKPFPRTPEGRPDMSFSPDQIQGMGNVVLSTMPVTPFSKAARATTLGKPDAAELVRQSAVQNAADAGLTIPKSYIKQGPLINLGERFGGKQAIEATARAKSQARINELASQHLGLPKDTPVTPEILSGIRQEAGAAYEAVKNIGTLTADKAYKFSLSNIARKFSGASRDFPELASADVRKLAMALNKPTISSEGAVEMVKNLRNAAKSNLGPMSSAQDKLMGRAQREAANALDDLLERNIEPKLGKEMLDAYRAARQTIAKTHTIEEAMVGGNVSSTKLGQALKKGKPLIGELRQIAKFGQDFPRLGRVEMSAPVPGGALEPMAYGVAGHIGGGPVGAGMAAVPIIGKPIARHLMTAIPKSGTPAPSLLEQYLIQRGAWGAHGLLGE